MASLACKVARTLPAAPSRMLGVAVSSNITSGGFFRFLQVLMFSGEKDAQQVKWADGALGKALALQAAGIQVSKLGFYLDA